MICCPQPYPVSKSVSSSTPRSVFCHSYQKFPLLCMICSPPFALNPILQANLYVQELRLAPLGSPHGNRVCSLPFMLGLPRMHSSLDVHKRGEGEMLPIDVNSHLGVGKLLETLNLLPRSFGATASHIVRGLEGAFERHYVPQRCKRRFQWQATDGGEMV